MSRILTLCVFLVALASMGCASTEPPYRAEDVVFDEGMLGRWVKQPGALDPAGPSAALRVQMREVSIRDGRLDGQFAQAAPIRADNAPLKGTTRAYALVPDDGAAHPPGDALWAYLIRRGKHTFLGVQAPGNQLGIQTGFAVTPVHVLWLCDRSNDTLTLRAPRTPVVWVPCLRPIDPPSTTSRDVPSMESLKKNGVPFTGDIDRLLRIYSAYADNPDFWDEPTVYRRVAE